MRQLAPSEKKLLLILSGVVFFALNMLGLHAFFQARADLQRSIQSAKNQLASQQAWLVTEKALQPAEKWINSHPMQEMSTDDASAELLKTERNEAEKAGLKVTEENLTPPEETPQGKTVSLQAKFAGPFEGVVRMLFALQTPTAWRSIEKLVIKSDAQPPNVIVELELKQFFRSEGGSSGSAHSTAP